MLDAAGADMPSRYLASSTEGTREPLLIVGVGASDGGLEAFNTLLGDIPPDTGLAFVYIQRSLSDQGYTLVEHIARHATLPVSLAAPGTVALANQVYVLPPNTVCAIADGILHIASDSADSSMPIDRFFYSLAHEFGQRAVGVILSGTGADGALGLASIREHGGLTIAQTPASAVAPEMPQQAIMRQGATHILDSHMMADVILRSVVQAVQQSEYEGMQPIIALVLEATGHDFRHYKTATLKRRIDRRMQLLRLDSHARYYALLQQNHREIELLLQDLLIGVTAFFRDPPSFDALARTVLPSIVRSGRSTLRIWVPGCASGEEAYSLAILFHEQLQLLDAPPALQVFATDIDLHALASARQGRYSQTIASQITPARLARYFVRETQQYRVIQPLRELCLFAAHNLISDPPFGNIDLIACRNLLIYFDANLQRQIIPVFHYALAPGGFLFLGAAEHATGASDGSELFQAVALPHRIYQRIERPTRLQIDLPWVRPGRMLTAAAAPVRPSPALLGGGLGVAIERALLSDYTPAAVAINEQSMVVHFSGRTDAYLTMPAGAPTMNLFALAHPALRLPLRMAIREATQGEGVIVREVVALSTPTGIQQITITVQPLVDPGGYAGLLLVVFQAAQGQASAMRPGATNAQLAQELQRTRATLEVTIDELRDANMHLTSANEELRSLNEEIQSINEELQTSNEEIQSINEELQTVNAELSRKIEELDRTNADLSNLFASAQIPAIYLRTDGRIARFTPQATELFALIDSDIGRPIGDLSPAFHADELHMRIAQVLRDFTPIDMVVSQPEQERWWAVRLRPYYTLINTIDGVVVTFADISVIKRAEAELQGAHDVLEQRVTQRTTELAAANLALQSEMRERQRSDHARQKLLRQLLVAQEEERRRIARELHDQMGQDLTALTLGLRTLYDQMSVSPEEAKRVRQLQLIAVQITQELRNLVVHLRPSGLDDLGLPVALRTYIEQWASQAQVAADLHISGLDDERLPLSVETAAYRLVQEGLTNVFKHAKATEVSVIIERHTSSLRLIIEDDGIGFTMPPAAQSAGHSLHLGLLGMRERVALLGGNLTIEASPGSGTTIFADIPLTTARSGGEDEEDNDLPG